MNTAKQAINVFTRVQTSTIPWATVYAISAAVLTGVLIISAVGFGGAEVLHNAAHDIRHGLAFPCH